MVAIPGGGGPASAQLDFVRAVGAAWFQRARCEPQWMELAISNHVLAQVAR